MRWALRSAILGASVALLAACGGEEGPQGPPGDGADVETERFEEHDECPAGGVAVVVNGEESTVICDGEAGDDGDAGDPGAPGDDGDDGMTPDVTAERVETHDECPAGGVVIAVSVDGGAESDTVVCDGDDGAPGESPTIDVEDVDETSVAHDCGAAGGHLITVTDADGSVASETVVCNGADGDGSMDVIIDEDPAECGDAGGVEVAIGSESPFVVCNGSDGDQGAPGDDGDDGFSPVVTVTDVEPGETCAEGGVTVEITSLDDQGDEVTDEFTLCNGGDSEPVDPAPAVDYCGDLSPSTVEMTTDETTDVFAQVYVDGFTGDQSGDLGSDYVAQAGYAMAGDVPGDGNWTWVDATPNEDFSGTANNDEWMASFASLAAGSYRYVYRVTTDGQNWTYCGADGPFETAEYDEGVDSLPMEVTEIAADPEITECYTSYPSDITMREDEATEVYSRVVVPGYTGEDGTEELGADYAAQAGYGVAGGDIGDGSWTWVDASVVADSDFAESNEDEWEATFDSLDPGSYEYLYRVTLDGEEWTYCGAEEIFDAANYEGQTHARSMEITAVLDYFLSWEFEGGTVEDQLTATSGTGEANFSDAEAGNPLGTSDFIGDGTEWWFNAWPTETTFPADDETLLADFPYYNFEGDYSGNTDIIVQMVVERSSTGPALIQVGAEFSDGSLGFLPEPLELPNSGEVALEADISPSALEGDHDPTDEPVAYRVYGYGGSGSSGTLRLHGLFFSGQ